MQSADIFVDRAGDRFIDRCDDKYADKFVDFDDLYKFECYLINGSH